MIDPLPEEYREFLTVMGLADEFTLEMARRITGLAGAEEILVTLTEQNAFVTRLPDNRSFRFHHMMKECTERAFATLEEGKQSATVTVTEHGMRQSTCICMRSKFY